MRYLTCPAPITLMHYASGEPMKDGDSGKPDRPWTLARWALMFPLVDRSLAQDRKDRRAVRAIRLAFVPADPGDVIALEDDHWERVKKVVEKSTEPLAHPTVLEQFADFEDAFLNAKEECPTCQEKKCPGHKAGELKSVSSAA